jgi:two-component system sensor histidine kinase MprB
MTSLRSRLSLAAGVTVFVVLAAVSVVLYFFYAANLRSRVDGNLVHAANQASTVTEAIKRAAVDKGVTPFGGPVTVGSADLQILSGPLVVRQDSTLQAVSARDIGVADGTQPAYFSTLDSDHGRYRVYTSALSGSSPGSLVRVSRPVSDDTSSLRRAALLLSLLTLAGAGSAAVAGRLLAGRVLRPIGELTSAAEEVARTRDPGARLAEAPSATESGGQGRPDEVGRLATAFNAMLAELDQSVAAQRQLVADASHELRTPLTSLTTNLDLLQDGRGVGDPQAPRLVEEARREAGQLSTLVDDLVDLARYGEQNRPREDTRLDLLAARVVQRASKRNGVQIDLNATPCLVHVDPSAIERALSNLLDNAMKWSPAGSVVHVEVLGGRCAISDAGPGIPEQDVPHVFERFYRSRTAYGLPGSGLGLAIVAQIAQANQGSITVESTSSGSTFTLVLPTLTSSSGDSEKEGCDVVQPVGEQRQVFVADSRQAQRDDERRNGGQLRQ